MTVSRDQLARIILSGVNDIEEWRLGDATVAFAKGYPREYVSEIIDDWGIVFVDVTLDANSGEPVCHEVNGPNAVGSDALTGDSSLRARNEAHQAISRAREFGYLDAQGSLISQVVTVHAHQHWKFFRTGGEFYPRVARFADYLEEDLPDETIHPYSANDVLGDEKIAVVMGDVPSIAENLEFDSVTSRFEYRGRPVIFIGNPNLLSELIRTEKFNRADRDRGHFSLRVFHAWRFSGLIHDKVRQQDFFENTGIRPLRNFTGTSVDDILYKSRQLLTNGPVVLKPSDTSGGTGVHVIVPAMCDEEILSRINMIMSDCRAKYGVGSDTMILPIRGFEFVRSTGYTLEDGDHLWDLRIAVQFEPGRAICYPVSLRLTPDPFDESTFYQERRQWVSNVSGRQETLLKSGMDDLMLRAVGMTDALLEQAMLACVKWTSKAWDATARDGGKAGAVYEDVCDEMTSPFYRGDQFT